MKEKNNYDVYAQILNQRNENRMSDLTESEKDGCSFSVDEFKMISQMFAYCRSKSREDYKKLKAMCKSLGLKIKESILPDGTNMITID